MVMTQETNSKRGSCDRKNLAWVDKTRERGQVRTTAEGRNISGNRGQNGSRIRWDSTLPQAARQPRSGVRHNHVVRLLGGGQAVRGRRLRTCVCTSEGERDAGKI